MRRFFTRNAPVVAPGPAPRFEARLDHDVLEVVYEVCQRYGSMSNAKVKAAVYRTDPMRFVLQVERSGKRMLNKPVLYKDKTARELLDQY